MKLFSIKLIAVFAFTLLLFGACKKDNNDDNKDDNNVAACKVTSANGTDTKSFTYNNDELATLTVSGAFISYDFSFTYVGNTIIVKEDGTVVAEIEVNSNGYPTSTTLYRPDGLFSHDYTLTYSGAGQLQGITMTETRSGSVEITAEMRDLVYQNGDLVSYVLEESSPNFATRSYNVSATYDTDKDYKSYDPTQKLFAAFGTFVIFDFSAAPMSYLNPQAFSTHFISSLDRSDVGTGSYLYEYSLNDDGFATSLLVKDADDNSTFDAITVVYDCE